MFELRELKHSSITKSNLVWTYLLRNRSRSVVRIEETSSCLLGKFDSPEPPELHQRNWLRRLFRRARFVAVAIDDARHSLFRSTGRIAFLACHPCCEVEYGREVAIRNGVSVGVAGIELNPYC